MVERQAPGVVNKKGLAGYYGVTVDCVRRWQKLGLSALPGHGPRGKQFFDIPVCDEWLAAQGIIPAGPENQPLDMTDGSTGEGTTPSRTDDEGLGLGAAVGRIERLEREMAARLAAMTSGQGPMRPTAFQSQIRAYGQIVDQLRKGTEGLLKLEVARGELVRRSDYRDTLVHLSAVFRSHVDRFAREVPGRILGALGQAGVEIGDMGAVQRAIRDESAKLTDNWLRALSDEVRKGMVQPGLKEEEREENANGSDTG